MPAKAKTPTRADFQQRFVNVSRLNLWGPLLLFFAVARSRETMTSIHLLVAPTDEGGKDD
ncbi:MAG TPA: hypothetical protein VEF35_09570 [Candidatus Bathyarchaeia archaeon]|nr:hypothetical protein [Candidatus Bathyarchaeia archaeon]